MATVKSSGQVVYIGELYGRGRGFYKVKDWRESQEGREGKYFRSSCAGEPLYDERAKNRDLIWSRGEEGV